MPRGASPAAMAPEDTSTTWLPAADRAARASTRASSRPGSSPPTAVVNDDEPTLTTIRFAAATAWRACDTPLLLVGLASTVSVVELGPLARGPPGLAGGLALGGADAVVGLQPHIGATTGHEHRDAGGGGGLPVEGHIADRHRAAGHGAGLGQRLLDAQPGQPVGQVADGLVVGE